MHQFILNTYVKPVFHVYIYILNIENFIYAVIEPLISFCHSCCWKTPDHTLKELDGIGLMLHSANLNKKNDHFNIKNTTQKSHLIT